MAEVRQQQYALVAIDAVKPHPANPRRSDVDAIAHSVEENGFYGAIVVQRSSGYILVGSHRWDAARRASLRELPVVWLECSDAEAKRILLVDNRSSDAAGYDDKALAELLDEVRAQCEGLDGTGYSQEAFDALIQTMGDVALLENGALPDVHAAEPDAGGEDPEPEAGETFQGKRMTFRLHDEQADVVKRAVAIAQELGCNSPLNKDPDGNAITRICQAWVTAYGNR